MIGVGKGFIMSEHARCRICTSNDEDALIDHIAEAIWESRRHGSLDDQPWSKVHPYWYKEMRQLAETAVNAARAK